MSNQLPHITILIPVYNGIEFLEECLSSVILQTYPHWIAIVAINGHGIDGGEVAVVAQKIACRDSRIKMIIQGPPIKSKVDSLNHAMNDVMDDWVALLDCDDKWEPTKLEKQVNALLSDGRYADVIGTHCRIFGEKIGDPILPGGYIDSGLLEKYNPIVNSSSLIKKKWCHWEYNEINEYAIEDYYLWMRICLEGGRLYNVPEKLTWHRVYAASAFNSKHYSNKKLLEFYREKRRMM